MKNLLKRLTALALAGCLLVPAVSAASTPTFTDVPNGEGIYEHVLRAAREHLVAGKDDGSFGIGENVSNAQFATMIGNLFYASEVDAYRTAHASEITQWWQPNMALAYQKGLLAGTTVGENRQLNNGWSKTVVESAISRYDMAQVIANVITWKKWQAPSTLEILSARQKIGDWSSIPSKYQNAVATAYAKSFLTGQTDGTFGGSSPMLREHSAVVLCKLLDASKTTTNTNTYTNTTNLVNGQTPTKEHVESAVNALRPLFSNWDVTTVYNSTVLGASSGSAAFAYTLSDRVFGNLPAAKADPEDVKPGDLLYIRSMGTYALVQEVDRTTFDYVYCNNLGGVSWNNTYNIKDLTSRDTVYTRYTDNTSKSYDDITEDDVYDALDDFMWDEYDDGDDWDMDEDYKPEVFNNGRSTDGAEAFAYYLSDYIFGDLDYAKVTNASKIRVGDLVHCYDKDEYWIVTDIKKGYISYVYARSNGEVDWTNNTYDIDDLDSDDTIYTRYPDSASSSKNTLTNGKSVTESNVSSLLNSVMSKSAYKDGADWDTTQHSTYLFGTSRNSMAFAGMVSDEIFGEIDEKEHSKINDLKVGDVIYLDDEGIYGIVSEIAGSGDSKRCYYGTVKNKTVEWDERLDFVDFDSKNDEIYTRYTVTTSTDRLSDGTTATTSHVQALLEKFQDKYEDGDTWDDEEDYTPNDSSLSSKKVYGARAFAYYLSDYIFGDLPVRDITSKVSDGDDISVGDLLEGSGEYLIVTDVSSSRIYYVYANKEKVDWDGSMSVSYLDDYDVYTRYPK